MKEAQYANPPYELLGCIAWRDVMSDERKQAPQAETMVTAKIDAAGLLQLKDLAIFVPPYVRLACTCGNADALLMVLPRT